MKKLKLIPLFCLSIVLFCHIIDLNAKVIYKDISSVSIRTNFTFDYDSIQDDGVPDIDETNVYVNQNSKYVIESAEWYLSDTDQFTIGAEPRILIYLETVEYPYTGGDNDYFYRFLSSYSSSNCYVSNGSFVSATRVSNSTLKVIIKLNPIKGTYNPPQDAYWTDNKGTAVWTPDNTLDSGYYDLTLYRDGSSVTSVDRYHGTTYNFYQFMTKEGEYTFRVRTVPGTDHQGAYGKRSEYLDSTGMTIDSTNVNVGGTSMSNNGGINAGWVQSNGSWYFYRPDGSMLKNTWTLYNNVWYFLTENGTMKTGFATINGNQYYFNQDGAMLTGWLKSGESYYFFNTIQGSALGSMCKNMWVSYDNKWFYFDNTGVMVTGWKQITDSSGNSGYYYFYPQGSTSGMFGYMAANTTINGFTVGGDGKWTGQ